MSQWTSWLCTSFVYRRCTLSFILFEQHDFTAETYIYKKTVKQVKLHLPPPSLPPICSFFLYYSSTIGQHHGIIWVTTKWSASASIELHHLLLITGEYNCFISMKHWKSYSFVTKFMHLYNIFISRKYDVLFIFID